MKLSTVCLLMLTLTTKVILAQSREEMFRKKMIDSIKRVYLIEAAIRNPALRRVNISTDYVFRGKVSSKLYGNDLAEAEQAQIRTAVLVTLPVAKWKKNSLSATFSFFNQNYNVDHIKAFVPATTDVPSSATGNKAAAGLSVSYQRIDSLFGKTVIYMASASALTGKLGEIHQYSIMGGAMLMLKQTPTSSLALGMIINYDPSNDIPVAPVFLYWRKLRADLELNINLPQQLKLRKTLSPNCWAGFGTSLSGSAAFFNNSYQGIPPKITYSSLELKTGPGLEFRFARYLMLGVNAGILTPMMSRFYERYESSNDYFIKNKISATPFANVTVSLLPVF